MTSRRVTVTYEVVVHETDESKIEELIYQSIDIGLVEYADITDLEIVEE